MAGRPRRKGNGKNRKMATEDTQNTTETEMTAEVETATLESVLISDVEKSRIDDLQTKRFQAAMILADASVRLAAAKEAHDLAQKAYVTSSQAFQERCNLIAEGYGIDPTKPGWTFNMAKGEFIPTAAQNETPAS